ncbi:MAG: acyl-ACP--UDP-N-acetylglucosamine O-acyltransferase [Burkholderiales bacterium]|nr:MAG: acyl-ACP--UDP-N-acetylglucosamine O-acyltransferase [Burkholderiales bacterium]
MASIHPTAIVDREAELDASVEVGPYAVIGPGVRLHAGCTVAAHAVLEGRTTIGRNNHIHAFAAIGGVPQDKKYGGEPTRLEIGDDNTFREYVTVNCGTVQDQGVSRIGHRNWIMAYVHIAHDCVVGDDTIMANCSQLAGHVEIGDWAILGGFTGVHQYCKIGAHAMTGVGTVILHDLPPFVMASGNTAAAHGINSEGLRRRGFSAAAINRVRSAYRTLYKSGLGLEEARAALQADQAEGGPGAVEVGRLVDFLSRVSRGIVR